MKYREFKNIILKKGYKWVDEPLYPNLIGERTDVIKPNLYNDIMYAARINKKGEEEVFSYLITTLPGRFHLESPGKPEGCGILLPGQYFSWVKGLHGKTRPHEALVQLAGAVEIVRDNDRDSIPEITGPLCKKFSNQYIGLNIHASWSTEDMKFIDKDSAACQVASRNEDHEKMMSWVDEYLIKKYGFLPTIEQLQDFKTKKYFCPFGYTLLVESDLKKI